MTQKTDTLVFQKPSCIVKTDRNPNPLTCEPAVANTTYEAAQPNLRLNHGPFPVR